MPSQNSEEKSLPVPTDSTLTIFHVGDYEVVGENIQNKFNLTT